MNMYFEIVISTACLDPVLGKVFLSGPAICNLKIGINTSEDRVKWLGRGWC